MFDDKWSTKTFLTLENFKSHYNNVSHLQVEEEIIDETTSPPTVKKQTTTTTEPAKILDEFKKKFQAIYSNQPTVDGSEANIIDFLNSDGDTRPLTKINSRKSKIFNEEFPKWKVF